MKDCTKVKSFFVKFYLLLAKFDEDTDSNDDFINNCFLDMDKDFLILLNLSQTDLVSKKAFENYLSLSGANPKLTEIATRIYRLKRNHLAQKVLIDNFIKVASHEVVVTDPALKYKKLYSYLRAIESVPDENPLKNFVELAVALRTNNKQWVKKLSRKIINSSTLQFAAFLDPRQFTGNLFARYIEGLYETLSLMKKDYKDPMLLRMLSTKIILFLPLKYKDRFLKEFDANWSLSELREIVTSREYGQSAIGLWFNVLQSRTTETEVNNFLDKVLKKSAISKLPEQEFWIFKYFYPGDSRRTILNERLNKFIKNKKNVHDQLITTEFLEREAIQRNLKLADPRLGRALFKVKRDIFKDVLESGLPSQFALYNLFLLGEKDPELFWWFVL